MGQLNKILIGQIIGTVYNFFCKINAFMFIFNNHIYVIYQFTNFYKGHSMFPGSGSAYYWL